MLQWLDPNNLNFSMRRNWPRLWHHAFGLKGIHCTQHFCQSNLCVDPFYSPRKFSKLHILSKFLQYENSVPNNLPLLALVSNFFPVFLYCVLDAFILSISNTLIKFITCMLHILSSPTYYFFMQTQIAFVFFKIMILVKMVFETRKNTHAFAFNFTFHDFLEIQSHRVGFHYRCLKVIALVIKSRRNLWKVSVPIQGKKLCI